jgi:hypothetical protein
VVVPLIVVAALTPLLPRLLLQAEGSLQDDWVHAGLSAVVGVAAEHQTQQIQPYQAHVCRVQRMVGGLVREEHKIRLEARHPVLPWWDAGQWPDAVQLEHVQVYAQV